MLKKILMPAGGQTSSDGKVVKWNKQPGDSVKKWDVLVEVETDKSVFEIEASGNGFFLGNYFEEGEIVQAGSVLGYLGNATDKLPPKNSENQLDEEVSSSEVETVCDDDEYSSILPSNDEKWIVEAMHEEVPSLNINKAPYQSTPGAKKRAREMGISLSHIIPANEKAIKNSDVESYIISLSAEKSKSTVKGVEYITTSTMRKTIANRMNDSLRTNAMYHLIVKVDMTNCMNALVKWNKGKEKTDRIGINDIVMKAACLSIKEHPFLNAFYGEDQITIHHSIHFGLAVAMDNGLVVPVLRDAELMTLREIAKANKENIEKIRSKAYSPDDIKGSTITLSSLGGFGIYITEPILNSGESCIIGIGEIEDVLKLVEGQVEVHKEMCITGGFDHRLVDGAEGAKFLKSIKKYLEDLETMLLDL